MIADKRNISSEKGQGLVEYGLILALVSVVAVSSLGGVGNKVTDTFSTVENAETVAKIQNGYIPIASADELDNLRKDEEQTFGKGTDWEGKYVSGLDKSYIQVADIDLSDIDNFNPFGTFSGLFDGGGYAISHLTINNTGPTGLFSHSDGASFRNISLYDINVYGGFRTGGLVGHLVNSSIVNCYVSGSIEGSSNMVGGLVGLQEEGSSIDGGYVSGNVSGVSYVGGLIGKQIYSSSIVNSYSMANVSGSGYYIGGFMGRSNRSSIKRSGYVLVDDYGLVGVASNAGTGNPDLINTDTFYEKLRMEGYPNNNIPIHK